MGRPTKENSLTPEDVVNAAINCVEKEGISALGVNRVARELRIKPPAIYKHIDGNASLRKAVAVASWRKFFAYYKKETIQATDFRTLLKIGGHATRNFARLHKGLYEVMMRVQLQPDDPEAMSVIQEALGFFQMGVNQKELTENQLIDTVRMVNAAVYGYITLEQVGLLTLSRSTDDSFEVMLEALSVAIEHIAKNE